MAAEEQAEARGEERKVVTVLFCDLVGSTAWADDADPEDVHALLTSYHRRMRTELERHGGTVEKFIGDAVMAVFGVPLAHEDDADRAVRAALRILEAIDDLNAKGDLDLVVRIGITTGETLVSRLADPDRGDHFLSGDVVNVAARLQTVAPEGGILVDDATHRLTAQRFDYIRLEPVAVKGKAAPLRVWRPTGLGRGPRARSEAAPLVGRVTELTTLRSALHQAIRRSEVQLATITGEAGVGKSRLVRELREWAAELPDGVRWRHGRCVPYGEGVTFRALEEIVKAEAGILGSDDQATAAAKLATAVSASSVADPDWVALRLGPLVGVSPLEDRQPAGQEESFTAWRRFLEALGTRGPLVVAIEDAHWADPALLDFLDQLVDWVEGVPMLVVVTARPELHNRTPGFGRQARNAISLALSPLDAEATEELLGSLLAATDAPPGVRAALVERSGGNPLYAEQFVRLLAERELLGAHGAPVTDIAELPVPGTVGALIAARLDTLPADRKALLADASVLGRVFWTGGLAALSGQEAAEVTRVLRELGRAEFVRRAPRSTMAGQEEYAFWHGLVREVAYASLPRAVRASKHLAAAAWIEATATDRLAHQGEALAHHYLTALELRRAAGDVASAAALAEPTARRLAQAGDHAMALELGAAVRHYRHAVELLDPGDAERPAILLRAGTACFFAGDLARAEPMLREAATQLEARADPRGAGQALTRLSEVLWQSGDGEQARRMVQRAIELLETADPGEELAHAYEQGAFLAFTAGRPRRALELADQALAVARPDQEARVYALGVRCYARSYLGDLGGLEDVRAGIRIAESSVLPACESALHGYLAEQLWYLESPEAGLDAYRSAVAAANRYGRRGAAAWLEVERLRLLLDLGRWDELLKAAEELSTTLRAGAVRYPLAMLESCRAAVLVARGQTEAAATVIRGCVPRAREIGDLQVLAPALTTAAVVEEAAGCPAEALRLVAELDAVVRDRSGWFWGQHLPDLARVSVAADDLALGERLVEEMAPIARRPQLGLLTARATLATAHGDHSEGARLHAKAAAGWLGYGHPLERGRALLGLGRCRRALGEVAGARTSLGDARTCFARLGAEPLLGEVERLLSAGSQLEAPPSM